MKTRPLEFFGEYRAANVSTFIAGYTAALLWSTAGTDAEGAECEDLQGFELSASARAAIRADCFAFFCENLPDLFQHNTARTDCPHGQHWLYAGHDFALNRIGAGVGFWDRGTGAVGDRLSAAANLAGNCEAYIGDDGQIWIAGREGSAP